MLDRSATAMPPDLLSPGSTENPAWDALVPSEEIREFAATAREQFASLFPSGALHEIQRTGTRADTWNDIVEQGYTSIALPEELGGLGTLTDLVTILEEAGRALLPLPLTTSAAAVQTLLRAGLGHEELASTRTGLVPTAVMVNPGQTVTVYDGALVDEIVTVASDGVVARFAVDSDRRVDPGAVDPSRASAAVTVGKRLAIAEVSGNDADDLLPAARVCIAADLVGVGALSLQSAIEHALVREQFGRRIGSFQAIKHMLADTHVALERARSLVAGAAAAVSEGSSDARRLSLLAKAGASEAALRATNVRTQLLGAMGLTFESDNHLAVRRVQQTAPFLGGSSDLYVRAATHGRTS